MLRNQLKFYVNCSALTGAYDWQYKYCLFVLFVYMQIMLHCGNRSFLEVTWQMFEKKVKMEVKWQNHRIEGKIVL
jgi:hypothetical protein